jgi:hypothetical protein
MNPAVHQSYRDAVLLGDCCPRHPIWCAANESPILALRLTGRPPAVVREVPKSIVFSIDGKALLVSIPERPIAEGFVVAPPLVADRDASTSVSGKAWSASICASGEHPLPYPVEASACVSVSQSIGSSCKPLKASAGRGFARPQIAANGGPAGSAITNGVPQRSAPGRVSSFGKNRPEAKSLSGQINEARVFCHRPLYDDHQGFRVSEDI